MSEPFGDAEILRRVSLLLAGGEHRADDDTYAAYREGRFYGCPLCILACQTREAAEALAEGVT